jgi:hypothetical protein
MSSNMSVEVSPYKEVNPIHRQKIPFIGSRWTQKARWISQTWVMINRITPWLLWSKPFILWCFSRVRKSGQGKSQILPSKTPIVRSHTFTISQAPYWRFPANWLEGAGNQRVKVSDSAGEKGEESWTLVRKTWKRKPCFFYNLGSQEEIKFLDFLKKSPRIILLEAKFL